MRYPITSGEEADAGQFEARRRQEEKKQVEVRGGQTAQRPVLTDSWVRDFVPEKPNGIDDNISRSQVQRIGWAVSSRFELFVDDSRNAGLRAATEERVRSAGGKAKKRVDEAILDL